MQNIVEAFKNLFQTLSRATRTIFKYLHWMCKKYRSVFPTIDHIANETGCSRRTVFNVLNYLVDCGFICVKRRPYQSNLYFMPNEILGLNLNDNKTFEREPEDTVACTQDCTVNCTVLCSISDINKSHEENDDASKEAENIAKLKEAVSNRQLPLSSENLDFFCIRYGFEAVKSVLKRIVRSPKLDKNFKSLDNPCGYLTICLRNEGSA